MRRPYVFLLISIVVLAGCGDDGSTDPPEMGQLTAVWELQTTVTSNTCGLENGETSTDQVIIMQCGNRASVIAGPGLWGSATIDDGVVSFSGTEVRTDDADCESTHQSSGSASGSSRLLEGTLTSNVTYNSVSCASREACTVEMASRFWEPLFFQNDCLERDQFGDPAASPYILPYPAGESYVLATSYCQPGTGHRLQQSYDFLIPIGDPIVAARDGVVRQVDEDAPDDGQGTDYNHVMVQHADGTVAFYAHLQQNGVLVEVGDQVEAGQVIASAGWSGTNGLVHLHFGVYDGWPPTEGEDQAVNFRNTEGPVDCRGGLVLGAEYTAR
jgi:hypothetical protein